ncbi:MAG: DegV family protein [Limosilactobacillus sp.]|uniref:DegV family protein n=1 Tax=Limosilactobacillus sp. TaxID=2773925 RepID=UPI0027039A89|nr:DegV family protein [Limosilactobacillus sp.]
MTVKIVTDSGASSYESNIDGVLHVNVPLTVMVDDKAWIDDADIDMDAFVAALKATKSKTSSSCPNIGNWAEAFDGADEIYVLTITSGLSGSYNSAVQAAEMYMGEHPDVKIHVFDSLSAGPQIRLLAYRIADLVNKGMSFDQVVELINDRIKKTDLLFVLEELDNLANNGRVNKQVAQIAHLLNIYVYGTTSEAGEFDMLGKMRGGKKMHKKLAGVMTDDLGYHGGKVFIDHVNCPDSAEKMANAIKEVYPDADITISTCGALCTYYAENGGLMIGFEK